MRPSSSISLRSCALKWATMLAARPRDEREDFNLAGGQTGRAGPSAAGPAPDRRPSAADGPSAASSGRRPPASDPDAPLAEEDRAAVLPVTRPARTLPYRDAARSPTVSSRLRRRRRTADPVRCRGWHRVPGSTRPDVRTRADAEWAWSKFLRLPFGTTVMASAELK